MLKLFCTHAVECFFGEEAVYRVIRVIVILIGSHAVFLVGVVVAVGDIIKDLLLGGGVKFLYGGVDDILGFFGDGIGDGCDLHGLSFRCFVYILYDMLENDTPISVLCDFMM